MALLDKMINWEDFGDRLAEGWFEASNWMGKDARIDYVEGSGIAKGTDCIYPARAATLDPMVNLHGLIMCLAYCPNFLDHRSNGQKEKSLENLINILSAAICSA